MIPRIYQATELATGSTLVLDAAASHHLVRVLRLKQAAELVVFNGDGCEYSARICEAGTKRCIVELLDKKTCTTESRLQVTLLQGVSRSDRMDTCIQKSTELGVHRIIPYLSHRGTVNSGLKSEKKLQHWQRVATSACEQSGRCTLPAIEAVCGYEDALEMAASGLKILLDPEGTSGPDELEENGTSISLLIGPESGLDPAEVSLARTQGYIATRFGPRILRTETAGPAMIAVLQSRWGDLR